MTAPNFEISAVMNPRWWFGSNKPGCERDTRSTRVLEARENDPRGRAADLERRLARVSRVAPAGWRASMH